MINTAELRRGNLLVDHHGDEVAVVAIAENELSLLFEDMVMTGINPDLCNPISLTPVLLYRAGFSTPHNYMSTVVAKDGVMIDYHLGKFRLRENNRITIDYLHQLQNLHFALTGEELTINNVNLQSTS